MHIQRGKRPPLWISASFFRLFPKSFPQLRKERGAASHDFENHFETAPFGWCERFRGTDLRPISKPTTNPAKHPQGARRIRKAAKPPTAALRIAVGKEEQGSGRMTLFCSAGIKERRSKADFAPTYNAWTIWIFFLDCESSKANRSRKRGAAK